MVTLVIWDASTPIMTSVQWLMAPQVASTGLQDISHLDIYHPDISHPDF